MLTPNNKTKAVIGTANSAVYTDELKFITELGRSLLIRVHPKKVAEYVSESLSLEIGADICAVFVELDHIGLISSAFGASNNELNSFLNKKRFEKWLDFMPPQISFGTLDEEEFLLQTETHRYEYVSPLHINGEVKGALVAGFAARNFCTEFAKRLINAAAQMTAMSINLSAHYESTINSSISQAKEEHRRFTEAVLDTLPVSLYVIDRDYRIVMWNRHREIGVQGMPRDSVIGRNVFEVLARYPEGKLSREFQRAFETGNIERIEQRTTAADGTTKYWLVSKVPMRDADTGGITHVITVGEDILMRVEAIHAVGRAEKLAAVGRLAAGVVHEINNPLATISACAESLETRANEGVFGDSEDVADLKEYLHLIRSEAFRCKGITTGLLDFSRIRTGNRHPIDIEEVLKSSVNLLTHQKRGNNINIELETEENLPTVKADAGQIQQAVIALATNAIDAMPDGGTLTFGAFSDSRRLIIEVKDTGHGIASENLSKIFEPFFTTKEVGEGTGLGLAVCYGIITDHDGRVSVRSTIGKETTFSIFLPLELNADALIQD